MITRFDGEHRFLSNFWPARVWLEGLWFPTVEHAYMAAKTTDMTLREQISKLPSPGQAKKFGRQLKLRPDWEAIKLEVMEYLLEQKFATDPLKSQLIATGNQELIEGNTWGDHFWGVCNGHGKNHLGKLLMKIRSEHQHNLERTNE